MALLLGGFFNRSKFRLDVAATGETVTVTLSKGMTGWSGGVLGALGMKRATKHMTKVLHYRFTQEHYANYQANPPQGGAPS